MFDYTNMQNIYFSGTEEEWREVAGDKIGLDNVTVHFNWNK